MKEKKLFWLCAAFFAVCVGVMIFALLREPPVQIRFTPPPFDENAVAGQPDLTLEDGYGTVNTEAYRVSVLGDLVLSGDTIDVFLTNYEQNTCWLKLSLRDANGNILGETGLLRPGQYVQKLMLTTVPEATLPVDLVIMGYEPDTYYSVGNVTLQTSLLVP